MKILAAAISVIATYSLGDAKSHVRSKTINRGLVTNRFNKEALMSNARPYNRKDGAARTLEDEEEEENSLANYSIQFDSCISLQVKDDYLLDSMYSGYVKEGLLVSQKSYVIFNLCENNNCYYRAQNSGNTYVVDANTFILSMASYKPTLRQNYCEQCERNEDYCLGNYNGNDDQNNNNGGQRALAQNQKYINCDRCETYGCFDEDNDDDEKVVVSYQDALEWLEGVSECVETGQYYNDMALYAGLVCNGFGDGMAIGFFFDDACTLYTTEVATVDADDESYYEKALELMETAYTTTIPCGQTEIEYTNPYEEQEEDEDNNEEEQQQEQEVQVGEYCEELFDGDWGENNGDGEQSVQNLNNCIIDEEDEDGDNDAQEDENGNYDWSSVDWYEYHIDQNDIENSGKVCAVVKEVQGEFFMNWGSKYTYDTTGWAHTNAMLKKKYGLGTGGLIAVVLGALVIVFGSCMWAYNRSGLDEKKSSNKKPLIRRGDLAEEIF